MLTKPFQKDTGRERAPARNRFAPPLASELARELFNQITVINLCSHDLSGGLSDVVDAGLSRSLETLAKASAEATLIAERLALLLAEKPQCKVSDKPKRTFARPRATKVLGLF